VSRQTGRLSPWEPIFRSKLKYGEQVVPGILLGVLNGTASPGAIAVAVSLPAPSGLPRPVSLALGTNANPFCITRYLDDYVVVGCGNQVAGTGAFIVVVNISDPVAPFIEGSSAPDTDLITTRGICVVGDHAFTVSGSSTSLPQIGSWDLTDVTNPVLDDKLSVNDAFRSVCPLANDSNYIAATHLLEDNFRVISIADPTNISNPESITNNDFMQGILDMQPIGDYVICNSATDLGTPCIVTVNVTDPLVITIETNKLFEAHAGQFANGDLLIDGSFGYVVGNAANGGLHFTVLDLADPTNVAEEGYVFSDVLTPGDTTPMVLVKEPGVDIVWAMDTQRIHHFDVTNKAAPSLVRSLGPVVDYGNSETASPHQEAIWAKDRIFRVSSNDRLLSIPEM
jgi:hypothetical protein